MSKREPRIREVLTCWADKPQLVGFAKKRHGFGNTDVGFGVSYPSDLDEFEDDDLIPEGSVQIYGYWGPPEGYEVLVEETEYLQVLARVLSEGGFQAEATEVECLIEQT